MGRERRIACIEICSCVLLVVVSGCRPCCHAYNCFLSDGVRISQGLWTFSVSSLRITSFQMELSHTLPSMESVKFNLLDGTLALPRGIFPLVKCFKRVHRGVCLRRY